MNPTTPSLPFLLLLSALPPSFSDVLECPLTNCGTVTNISYPFRQQPPYCGFPEFKLHCDTNTLSLQISDIKYYVQKIFYPNHSILVVPELEPGSPNSDCPSYYNLNFILTPFTVSATNMDLFIIYNCTIPQQPFLYKAPCTEHNIFTFLGSNSSELEPFEWFHTCEIVEIPVLGFPGANASDYNRLVEEGFLLEWSVAADCSDCSSSGGQCGYNVDRNSFMCICNDQTRSGSCSESSHHKTRSIGVIASAVLSSIILLFISLSVFWVWRRKDPVRAASLDWTIRVKVIHGVAQGLLYLHKYSRLRIIHRDLKSGNILLDSEMNPKISDFGIARIFGGNQDLANTNRVVGTYGYMPPEYAMEGCFSEKSDVFSFGVLLLEIVSGKRNCGAPQVGDYRFLTGYVWRLWKAGRVSEMMDPVLHKSCPLQDLIRYVHVGLLCVQQEASERPAMSDVLSFLNSEILELPKPNRVAFFEKIRSNEDSSVLVEGCCSSNELTITAPNPR